MDQIKQKKLMQLHRMQEIQQKAEEQMIKRQIETQQKAIETHVKALETQQKVLETQKAMETQLKAVEAQRKTESPVNSDLNVSISEAKLEPVSQKGRFLNWLKFRD